jgi:hypothetical protein
MNDAELLRAIRKVPQESIDAAMRAHLDALSDGGRNNVTVYEIPNGPIVITCKVGPPTDAELLKAFREALLQATTAGHA